MENCAGCGKPIYGAVGWMQTDPFGGQAKRYHAACGDPFGLKAKDAEIARLTRERDAAVTAFLEYARHTAECGGGDGERCQCGYLDNWSRLHTLKPQPCPRCKGTGFKMVEVTFHGERNEWKKVKCNCKE